MLGVIEILITLTAVLGLCIFAAAKLRVPIGITPLAVLCLSVLWYAVMGCLGLLTVAGVVWFIAAAGAVVWCVLHYRQLRVGLALTPAFWLFVAGSLTVVALLGIRQPVFMEWDEFSFWGIAAKVVKETGVLYTQAETEMRVITYAPGLIMLDYIFQFLGTAFAPWKVYAAYDIMFFAIYAAAISGIKRKKWQIAVLGGSVLLLLPYLLTVYTRNIYVQPIYMSSYADIPMGLLFGAPMAVYFLYQRKSPQVMTAVCAAIAMISLTKETGFALALIAAGVVCFDLLFLSPSEAIMFRRWKGKPVAAGWCGALAASAVLPYVAWVMYRSSVTGAGATELGGSQNLTMGQMLLTGLRELVGIDRTERFARVMEKMWDAFFQTSLSELRVGGLGAESGLARYLNGSGFIIVCVIFCLLSAALLCANRGQRLSIACFALWSTLGFAAFYVFIGFTYVYIFHEWQEMSDYNRYIYPYYIGWLLAAVSILCCVLCKAEKTVKSVCSQLVLMGLVVVACLRTAEFVPVRLSVLAYPESYFAGRRLGMANVAQAKRVLYKDDRVFYVSMGDDGKRWFMDYYEFYPDVWLDYSFGGGSLVQAADPEEFQNNPELGIANYAEIDGRPMQWDPETELAYAIPGILAMPENFAPEQKQYYTTRGLTPAVLTRYLKDTGCTAVYLDKIDEAFIKGYGALFEDGLQSGARLYRVERQGVKLQLVPVPEGGQRT